MFYFYSQHLRCSRFHERLNLYNVILIAILTNYPLPRYEIRVISQMSRTIDEMPAPPYFAEFQDDDIYIFRFGKTGKTGRPP